MLEEVKLGRGLGLVSQGVLDLGELVSNFPNPAGIANKIVREGTNIGTGEFVCFVVEADKTRFEAFNVSFQVFGEGGELKIRCLLQMYEAVR